MKRIIGIDPGITGAYCVLSPEGRIDVAHNFPLIEEVKENKRKGRKSDTRIEKYYDRELLISHFKPFFNSPKHPEFIAYVELVHSRPGEGVASVFKFGDCFGQLKMVLACMNIPIRFVTPGEWCREMHKGIGNKEWKAKGRSWAAFERKFTDYARGFSKKPPDGIIDAALIAEFGRMRIMNGMDEWRFK